MDEAKKISATKEDQQKQYKILMNKPICSARRERTR